MSDTNIEKKRLFEENFLFINEEIIDNIRNCSSYTDEYNFIQNFRIIRSPYTETNIRTKILFDFFFRQLHFTKEIGLSTRKSLLYLNFVQILVRSLLFSESTIICSSEAIPETKQKMKEMVQIAVHDDPFTKEEITQLMTSISNGFIKNLALYRYMIQSNPQEEIEQYLPIVQTPSIPLPLILGKDLNEVIEVIPTETAMSPKSVKTTNSRKSKH